MVALALMVSCMPSAYTISASEAFGDGTEDIFTDGEITSEPAAEESTPDVSSADQEETEQAQQSTLTYENDSVKVTAEALEDGALPQNTALKADGVNENSSVSYDTVSQKLSAAATDKGSSLRGFFAYDVYFADGDGNRVEPNGRVRVTFEYKTPAAPELTDAASTSVTVEKLHYNSSTGDTDVNTLQANEDLKVLNVNEGKQIQTLQVETGNAAVFAVMWDSPETADVEAEAVSGNEDGVSIASEELTDGMDISDEPEQDAAETPAAENPEVTPDAEPSEAPAENPDAEPTEAPTEDPDVVEEPAEDIASPEEVPAADENGETSLIEVLGDDTNLRVSPSIEAEVLATVNAGTQLTLLDTVTAEDGATWYKVSWEGTEAYIRSDMAQVVDSSDEAEEPEDVQEEEIQPEITRYDYKSDEVNVKVTLTDPADLPDNAKLSVTPVELSQEAEDQITEEAIKEKKAIEKIHAYDIKFLVDGEEVQPGASVKVSVSLNDEKKIKDADVYHVDKNDNVENMDGSVAKNGDVEFETTHFSTYVIVQKGGNEVEVTIRHLDESGTPIYSEDKRTILVGGKINDYTKAQNWEVSKVRLNGIEVPKDEKIEVVQNSTIEVYYTPKHNENFQGPTSFYDYTVKAGIDNKTGKKYSFNMLGDAAGGENGNQKITSGKMAHNYDSYQYDFTVDSGYDKDDGGNKITASVNDYNENVKRTEGLLKEVGENGKGAVKFNYPEPGFFVDEDKIVTINNNETYLRRVIKDYKLVFDQKGDSYKLKKVIDENGQQCAEAGNNFFPLDKVPRREESDNSDHNYFFGMRYDVTFKIGDYVGPLDYTFSGDDDLWVVLDGKHIVIDLGGIHQAATKKVDLKKYVEGEDKEKEHTLTILYMERGAYRSNCQMEFTLPSARISEVTNVPTTDLVLKKVNKSQEALSGARFNLVNSETNESQTATSEEKTGLVNFTRLRPGTYTLTEAMAPNGYEASQESWIVEVTSSDDKKAVATLYKADDKTKIEKDPDSSYHIMNYTQEEIIESSMDYSKTATVRDWDARTYDINITAASTSTSSIVIERDSVADIMMVFDMSGSMNDDGSFEEKGRFDTVKDSLDTTKVYYYNTNTYPMIYIDGKWQYYNGSDWKMPSNSDYYYYHKYGNVYTWNSRITALKEAAIAFIKDTAAKSENSKIGITTFDGYRSWGYNYTRGNVIQPITTVGNSPLEMIKAVGKIKADGGTSPQKGLEEAQAQLKRVENDGLSKYIILFTDGAPSHESDTRATETSISTLKDKATIFTVALSSGGLKVPGSDKNNIEWMKYLATDENHAFNVSNASGLGSIFKTIQDTITHNIAITNATITDVIDPRFVIINDTNNTIITNEDLAEGKTITLKNGGVVSLNENGCQVVTWNKQTIPNKAEGKQWSNTITVRAKDEYIGGNNVPTNVAPDSKITTGYGNAILPQPKVNVKSDLVVNNNETTIFYGDTVPTAEAILKVLFDKEKPQGYVTQLDGQKNKVSYTIGADGQQINPKDFILTWYKDEACTQEIKVKDMAKVVPEPDSKQYYLKVTYISGKSDDSGVLTAHNSQKDTNSEYGVYTIKIITGQIQIIKKLETAAKEKVDFTFDVTNKDDVKIATAKATIEAGKTEGTVTLKLENGVKEEISEDDTSILTRLARGEYTVTETVNSNYTLKDLIAGNTTNCKNEVVLAERQIKFSIGTDTDSKQVLKDGNTNTTNGIIGVAVFTNEKSVADVKLVKVDAANTNVTIKGAKFALYEAKKDWSKASENPINADIVSGDNGRIDLNAIPVGNYLLEETKAATGYSLPTNPWRITVGGGGIVTVTVMDGNGHAVDVGNVSENGTTIYQITNTKVYSLPQSGGPGTYGFTISGVAILATALLLFINNKRREEEAKRS